MDEQVAPGHGLEAHGPDSFSQSSYQTWPKPSRPGYNLRVSDTVDETQGHRMRH